MTRLGSLGASGLGDPGQVGAQACAVSVFLVTALAVTVLCGPVLFLIVSCPVPRGALNLSFAFLVHMDPLFFTDGGVCVSICSPTWVPCGPASWYLHGIEIDQSFTDMA